MSGDYSRFTFDPKKNYSSVLKQQGRVSLDADANEAAEIQDRRWRAETMDIFGGCVVPDGPDRSNRDAFLITPIVDVEGRYDLQIGVGRIYVDGLLVENHGAGEEQFDPALEEMRGTTPLSYYDQPYSPAIGAVRPIEVDPPRTDLVYLRVWQREVTALEDPALREVALDGPDTATRLQTVWQVRIRRNFRAGSCDRDPHPWVPSRGRMTVATEAPPPSDHPCELSLQGGYRGLENRLYRVEIHGQGSLGEATFKWSRDNASVATAIEAVEEVDGFPLRRRLRLASLGRDPYLRFEGGDWVELLDDYMELHANRGYMARIVAPANEAERTLVVEFAESGEGSFFEFAAAFGFDPSDVAARHTRLRRWDQLDGTGSDGLLDVVTEAVHLEDGIRVQFSGDDLSPGPPTFNRGDYWVFAARAATGEVDELVDAPPRGIHRHHCRLALVEWGVHGPIVIEDCRNHWPPAVQVAAGQGCCTVIVEPDAGLTIQEAIESLPEDGGCVCIRAGVHRITAPITIDRSNVVLQGESPGATIVRNGFPLIVVGGLETETSNVRVLGLELVAEAGAIDISDFIGDEMTVPPHLETSATSAWEWALVRLDRCRNLALTDCVLRCTADRNMLLGILALGANDLRVHNNTFSSILAGVWVLHHAEAVSSKLTVTNNRMSAGGNLTDLIGGLVGILLAGEEVHVSGNSIAHFGIGVQVNMSGRGGARVLDNGISDALGAGISIQRGMRLEPEPKHRSVIRGNAIYSRSEGVRLAGIWINSLPGMDAKENQIDGCVFGMLLQDTDYAVVSGNRIRDALFVGISLSQGTHNRVRHNHFAGGNGAVLANGEASLEVTDNGIENMSAGGVLGLALRESMIVSRNRLTGCGYQGMELDTGDRAAFGIALDASATPRVQIVVESCQILNTGVAMDVSAVADCPAFGIWVSGAESCRVQGNQVRSESDERPAHTGDRALWLAGISDGEIGIDSPIASALVLDNRFVGGGGSPHLVEFSIWDEEQRVARTFDRITFNNNLCEHRGAEPDQNPATIVFSAPAGTGLIPRPPRVIAMGNQIRVTSSRAGFIACAFDFGSLANVVLLGNVADGRICNLGEGNIPTSYPGFNDVPFP